MTRRSSATVPRGYMRSSDWRKAARACRSMRRIAFTARPVTSRIRRRTSIGLFLKAAEAPITRTCSFAFTLLPALLLAGTASAQPADRIERDYLDSYVLARVANSAGEAEKAVQGYQDALASSPGSKVIAEDAF